jgi:penicillin G amidase
MRPLRAIIPTLVTVWLVWLLDISLGALPPLGRVLDPINGCMANAENTSKNYTITTPVQGLKQGVTVWLDNRMVPHIHADNETDVYYAQGYIHAYFRMWQMDMQTRAAAGRISEVAGEKALNYDRMQRRKGMVYAAEQSLKAMEAEPVTKDMLDAYTQGINQYISTLTYKDLPIEYKLMNFWPEPWTNLKAALLLKLMADDLTGYTEDIEMTALKEQLSEEDMDMFFPLRVKGSTPVIPDSTHYAPASLSVPAVPNGDIWAHLKAVTTTSNNYTEPAGIGSNNWAVGSSRTAKHAAILCNDPHLSLRLPALWFEVQMQTPKMNVYGVSLPGSPGVVIGFNDHISWGMTNNYRDVKDYYEIKSIGRQVYLFDGKQTNFDRREERIRIKGKDDYIDTVLYTVHGPVMYDEQFEDPLHTHKKMAMRWMAHRGTNELLCVYQLNRATDYNKFVAAIQHFECPAQNFVYADKQGNVAMWGQGQFVNKWTGQGRYIMEGKDSATLWKELIPMHENPHVLNPAQGFVSSANQIVTDSTYPYWYDGYFKEFRAWRINDVLHKKDQMNVNDMFVLQNDVYSELAAKSLPVMLQHFDKLMVNAQELLYLKDLEQWDYRLTATSKAATVYQIWWKSLHTTIWKERIGPKGVIIYPTPERTVQMMQDSNEHLFAKGTAFHDGMKQAVMNSWKATMDSVHQLERTVGTEWYKVKNTSIQHLGKIASFGYEGLKIGGWGNVVNAATDDHGPSWRMVVQMSKDIDAYGIYPGGQSGNPGSPYYSNFIKSWVAGKYYKLTFLPSAKQSDHPSIKYTWTLQPK